MYIRLLVLCLCPIWPPVFPLCVRGGPNQPLHRDLQWSIVLVFPLNLCMYVCKGWAINRPPHCDLQWSIVLPTKSNLHFDISSATVLSEPDPYILLTFQVSHLISICFRLGSFIQIIRPDPRPFVTFRNELIFYGEELLASRPTHKLEDHHLSAVRHCLFNIFAATLHT
jgi:hypothetical protein